MQARTSHSNLSSQLAELQSVIDAAEDGVFASFCSRIGVENVRVYEERQLKVAEEESQARLRFDQQVARLTHQ
jgi:structural maintenance of chromosome 1